MSILERQFLTPTHVAWPLRLSQEANEPWEIGACLLWAAHRCMRLRLALAYGFDDPRSTKGRFQDLLDALGMAARKGMAPPSPSRNVPFRPQSLKSTWVM